MLSTKSLNSLADKVAPQVADFVQNDARFFDVMCDLVMEGTADTLGETDMMVVAEIAMMVSERLALVAA
jgi:hypothetical protein